jgi:protein required for attachment to host cells
MKPHWILIANASQARLLQQEHGGPVRVLKAFHHPASRLHSSTLGDDKAGRELSGHGFGGAAFEPRMDAQLKEHLRFARELADELEVGAREGSYGTLALFASSPFLGELKQALHDGTRSLVTAMRDVDLTSVGLAEIEHRVEHELEQHPNHELPSP